MNPEIRPYQQGVAVGRTERAQQIRRDNDNVKVPKVTLYDHDYALFFHLTEKIKLHVISNNIKIPVPVMFGNGEKWSQIRQYGFLRDNNRKVLAPIIILKRNDVSMDERISLAPGQTFGGNSTLYPNLKLIPYKTNGMQYDRVQGQYLTKESTEFYLMDVPDYVRITYDMIIWTDLQEQMNTILQMIIPTDNHMWGDYYTFRTKIQSITHDNVNVPGEDRLIKTTVNLQVDGYLRNEYEYQQNKIQKAYSIKRVDFLNETTDEILFDQITDINSPNEFSDNIADNSNQPTTLKRNIRL